MESVIWLSKIYSSYQNIAWRLFCTAKYRVVGTPELLTNVLSKSEANTIGVVWFLLCFTLVLSNYFIHL